MKIKIISLEELKEVLSEEGETVEGFCSLYVNIKSTRSICNLGNNQYSVINESNDSEVIISFEEFNDINKTDIGKVINDNAFYIYGNY